MGSAASCTVCTTARQSKLNAEVDMPPTLPLCLRASSDQASERAQQRRAKQQQQRLEAEAEVIMVICALMRPRFPWSCNTVRSMYCTVECIARITTYGTGCVSHPLPPPPPLLLLLLLLCAQTATATDERIAVLEAANVPPSGDYIHTTHMLCV